MPTSQLEIVRLSGACGAEIRGVDLAGPLDEGTVKEIRQALLDHLVIVFRDQHLAPEQHKAFGRRFGPLNLHPDYVPLPGHPEILRFVKEAGDRGNIGGVWHSDVTFLERPALGSILYALEVPPHGGDTMWANQYLAYETLSEGLRRLLDGLTAVHSNAILSRAEEKRDRNATRSTKLRDEGVDTPEIVNEHPVVRTHPETGRRALFVNGAFTRRFSGMTEEESAPLLAYLYQHAARPEFTCRFRWERGSVAFWDNRCTQHYALNDYHGYRRDMHRVTVEGDRPF